MISGFLNIIQKNMKADKLIIGNIVTLDRHKPIMEALSVKDGRVQYVGSLAYAKRLCDENTKVLDYGKNFVYPGFIEGHCHGSIAGPRLAFFKNLNDGRTIDEYVAMMKEYMDMNPGKEYYFGAGWTERDKVPTAAMLDAICPDKVMALHSIDCHSFWLNTKAMERYGVNKAYAEKWGTDMVRVYPDGTPTGYISEAPAMQIADEVSQIGKENQKIGLLAWQDFLLAHGFTAFYEAGASDQLLDLYDELIREGRWKVRIYAGYLMNEHDEDYAATVRKAKEAADKYNNEYMHIIGVKIFMDGVVEAHTAWTCEEYADRPGYTGVKRFCDYDQCVELFKEASRLGLNVHCHTIGDGAVKFALDCIETAQLETGSMDMRNALAHLQIVRPEDEKRLADLNVIAVVAPLWMTKRDVPLQLGIGYLGKKRSYYSYPMHSFLNHNGIIAFHTDYPVSPAMSIPKSIYMACCRNAPKDELYYQHNPNECISREAAVTGLTLGPAYELKAEDYLGKLIIGYAASMSVYDVDFLHDKIEAVADAKLVATLVDGEELYHS